MSDIGYSNQSPSKANSEQFIGDFGYPEFWPQAYTQFQLQFEAIKGLMTLGSEMLKAAEAKAVEPTKNLICDLSRVTLTAACEVIVLCGNGCGAGAVKIVRGMFESQWTAEYLHQHPEEVEDYVEFSKVILWRKLCWLQKNIPEKARSIPQQVTKRIEDEFDKVKTRFSNGKGKVRWEWSKKSIREIADDIGRSMQYELPYAIACSIHHGNFEGLSAHFPEGSGEMEFIPPPSTQWIGKALLAAHMNVWFVLNTLNDSYGLGFDAQLDAAQPTSPGATES